VCSSDLVVFFSRYPLLSVMLSDDITIAAQSVETFSFPQWITDLPFIPVVKSGAHSLAANGQFVAPGLWVAQPTPSNPGGGFYAADYSEVTRFAKDENDDLHTESYTINPGFAHTHIEEYPDCVMPYAHLGEFPAGQNVRGYTVDSYNEKIIVGNNYLTDISVRFHLLNMGA